MRNNKNYLLTEVPKLHPLSLEYKSYWRAEKRKCVEGYWVGGYWMPGPLYFYVNFWHILLNKDEFTKVKSLGKPFLRDLEWSKAYVYTEAKGFSGFADDDVFTCFRPVKTIEDTYAKMGKSIIPSDDPLLSSLPPSCFDSQGRLKKYMAARDYLPMNHGKDKGKPLFYNDAKNVVDIECRGSGKSYWAAGGMIAHNFLFDGATDYDLYLASIKDDKPLVSETLVGAIDTFYSGSLLSKVQTGFNNLEGGMHFNDEYYPSPLSKKTTGSMAAAKTLTARYEEFRGNSRAWRGSHSLLHHRSFKDKPTAGNGTRPGLTILEEVGFMGNLRESLGALDDVTLDGSQRFGCVYMFGTGGDMDGGSTEAVQEVFYNPDSYDCLVFEDVWENRGKVGFFIPYTHGLNKFKDEQGNTKEEEALHWIMEKRKKKAMAKDKGPLNSELQNNPIKPSEAFLVTEGNVFPIAELRDQLGFVESSVSSFVKGDVGDLVLDAKAPHGVKFIKDTKNILKPATARPKKGDDVPGCVQIWEHPPRGKVPFGMYIAGTDPYDQDKSETTSMGSTFIYKIGDFREGGMRDMIVAEYTGRPDTAEEHHETVRRLLLYYNALDLYENERNTLKFHFKTKNSLYLLSKQPDILKATENSNVERGYGIHMTNVIKEELEIYARDWLLQEAGEGLLNLHKVYSPGLLQELISYNDKGNFDRVIAFLLCICNRLQHHHTNVVTKKKEIMIDPFFEEPLF